MSKSDWLSSRLRRKHFSDLPLRREVAELVERVSQQVPEIRAARILGDTVARNLERLLLLAALQKELDRTVSPVDARRKALQGLLDDPLRFVETPVSNVNLHEGIRELPVLRIARDCRFEHPARLVVPAGELVNPGELDEPRGVRRMTADHFPNDFLRLREPAEIPIRLKKREAKGQVERIALHGRLQQRERALGIRAAVSVVEEKIGGGFRDLGVLRPNPLPPRDRLFREGESESLRRELGRLASRLEPSGVREKKSFHSLPDLKTLLRRERRGTFPGTPVSVGSSGLAIDGLEPSRRGFLPPSVLLRPDRLRAKSRGIERRGPFTLLDRLFDPPAKPRTPLRITVRILLEIQGRELAPGPGILRVPLQTPAQQERLLPRGLVRSGKVRGQKLLEAIVARMLRKPPSRAAERRVGPVASRDSIEEHDPRLEQERELPDPRFRVSNRIVEIPLQNVDLDSRLVKERGIARAFEPREQGLRVFPTAHASEKGDDVRQETRRAFVPANRFLARRKRLLRPPPVLERRNPMDPRAARARRIAERAHTIFEPREALVDPAESAESLAKRARVVIVRLRETGGDPVRENGALDVSIVPEQVGENAPDIRIGRFAPNPLVENRARAIPRRGGEAQELGVLPHVCARRVDPLLLRLHTRNETALDDALEARAEKRGVSERAAGAQEPRPNGRMRGELFQELLVRRERIARSPVFGRCRRREQSSQGMRRMTFLELRDERARNRRPVELKGAVVRHPRLHDRDVGRGQELVEKRRPLRRHGRHPVRTQGRLLSEAVQEVLVGSKLLRVVNEESARRLIEANDRDRVREIIRFQAQNERDPISDECRSELGGHDETADLESAFFEPFRGRPIGSAAIRDRRRHFVGIEVHSIRAEGRRKARRKTGLMLLQLPPIREADSSSARVLPEVLENLRVVRSAGLLRETLHLLVIVRQLRELHVGFGRRAIGIPDRREA